MVARDTTIIDTVRTPRAAKQLTNQGGEDAPAILFGLIGAMVNAVTWTMMLLMLSRDPGLAITVIATVSTLYVLGLGALLWVGAARRGTI